MKTWVKLYTTIVNDPDIAMLSLAERGLWMMLLALAGQLDHRDEQDLETGQLDTPDRVAWYLRIDLDELRALLVKFAHLGMVENRDGVLFIPKYPKRQACPPSDRNEAVRERVRHHRRQVTPAPADVTPLHAASNEPVTHLEKNREDTDTEERREEVEVETAGARELRMHGPLPTPPPIVVFRDLTKSCPAPGTPMWEAIANLPHSNGHMETWRKVIQEWMLRGFKTRNIAGMLDWFHNGIPPRGPAVTKSGSARKGTGVNIATDPDIRTAIRRTEERWEAEHGA